MIDLSMMGHQGMLSRASYLAEITKRWGILCFGDSQIAGKANVADLTYRADRGFNFSVVQSGTYVKVYRRIGESVVDPLSFNISFDNIADQPYLGAGATTFANPTVGIGQVLTQMQIPSVITEWCEVGLALKQMVPLATYPSSGGSFFNQMVAFQQALEISQNFRTKIAVISAGNNDGFTAPDSAAIPANMALLYNGLISAFPGIIVCWIKIPADTINFPSFRADAFTNQATGFAALPLVRQIWVDDADAPVDHAHLAPNGSCTLFGRRAFWSGYDGIGAARPRTAATPFIAGDGPITATNGTSTALAEGAPIDQDKQVLIKVDMVGSGQLTTNTTPTGWTFKSSATSTTNPTTGFAVRLSIYERLVDTATLAANHGNMPATTVVMDSPATVIFAKIFTVRGSNPLSAPTIAQIVFATTTAGNVASSTGPSLTTLGNNRRVVKITVGFLSSGIATTVTDTGFTGGVSERNSFVIAPNTAAAECNVKSAVVATSGTVINVTNVASTPNMTSPVHALVEFAS